MRKYFSNVLILVGFLAMGTTFGQEVAHVSVGDLFAAMPEYKNANEEIEALTKRHETEIQRQQTALQAQVKKIEAIAPKDNPSQEQINAFLAKPEVQAMQKQIQEGQQALRDYSQKAQKEVQDRETALLEPIQKKAQDAINAVAARKGIKYVFDSSSNFSGLLYYNGGVNILNEVKAELGL